jgi:hypothetical protein
VLPEFFEMLGKGGEMKAWRAAHIMSWAEEQEGGRAIDDVLSKLLALIVRRFDVDASGLVQKKDLTRCV